LALIQLVINDLLLVIKILSDKDTAGFLGKSAIHYNRDIFLGGGIEAAASILIMLWYFFRFSLQKYSINIMQHLKTFHNFAAHIARRGPIWAKGAGA